MIGQIALLLGSNHTSHQLYGRIFLSFVLTFLRFHHHLVESAAIIFQFHFQKIELFANLHSLRLIAEGTHGKHPLRMLLDDKLTLSITRNGNLVSLILHASIRHGKAILVDDAAGDFLLCSHLERTDHQCKKQQECSFKIHILH